MLSMEAFAAQHREIAKVRDVCLDLHSPEESVREQFEVVRKQLANIPGEMGRKVSKEFEFWAKGFDRVAKSRSRKQLGFAAKSVLSEREHVMPVSNVGQYAMKATVHLIWRSLMRQVYGWSVGSRSFESPEAAVGYAAGRTYESLATELFSILAAEIGLK